MIGYSEEAPVSGHRIAVFKGERTFVLDPMLGLAEWNEKTWRNHLEWIGNQIRTPGRGYFTLEWVRH